MVSVKFTSFRCALVTDGNNMSHRKSLVRTVTSLEMTHHDFSEPLYKFLPRSSPVVQVVGVAPPLYDPL